MPRHSRRLGAGLLIAVASGAVVFSSALPSVAAPAYGTTPVVHQAPVHKAALAAPRLAAPLPEQLGPLNWNPIVFGGGVPVGGWAQLTLFRSGAVNFTGHFHDSGGTSYDVTCTFAVRAGDGNVFTFTKSGRVHGTFEAGSRDFDWGENPSNTAVGADWPNLASSWSWHANAGANVDIGALVDSTVKAVGQAATVIAIIA
jgi:hypothetical protein